MLILITKFIGFLIENKRSKQTTINEESFLKIFSDYLTVNKLTYDSIDEKGMIQYRRHLFIKGLKPKTVENYTRSVFSFYKWLESTNQIFMSPCPTDYVLYVKNNDKPIILTVDEVQYILNEIQTKTLAGLRFYTQVAMLYGTGMRKSELLSLTKDSIDFDTSEVNFIGKNDVEAALPLTPTVIGALNAYMNKMNHSNLPIKSEALWVVRSGEEASTHIFDYDIRRWRKKLNIHFSAHTLRRSMASHMLANGCNPYELSEQILRHKDISTLSRYLGVTIEELMRTQALLEEVAV
jgi:integrase/recombinase XerC